MALSGSINTSKTTAAGTGYPGYLIFEWSATQDAVAATSTISWALKVGSDYSDPYNWVGVGPTTVTLDGNVSTKDRIPSSGQSGYRITSKGCTILTGSKTVQHNTTTGASTPALSISSAVYLTSQNVSVDTTIPLTTIDRTAPTVSAVVSAVTVGGFTISATSTTECDRWEYSLDNGNTWTQYSTASGYSAATTLTNLDPATEYNVKVRARKKFNHVNGASSATKISTLGGAAILSCDNIQADADTVSFDIGVMVYQSEYTNRITIKDGSTPLLQITGLSWAAGEQTVAITLTAAQRAALLSAMTKKAFDATIQLESVDGTTVIQRTSVSALCYTTSASAPTLSGFTFGDDDEQTLEITGNAHYMIQGYGELVVTPGTATAKNYATIALYTATCGDKSVNSADGSGLNLGAINQSGVLDIQLTITDSRGWTVTQTHQITVMKYERPRWSPSAVRRENNVNENIQLVGSGSISSLVVEGVQKNSLTSAMLQYRATDSAVWSTAQSFLSLVTHSGTTYSVNTLELVDLDASKSYYLRIMFGDAMDDFIGADETYVIPRGTPNVSIRRSKIGVRQPAPEYELDVNGSVNVSGDYYTNGTKGLLVPDTDGVTDGYVPIKQSDGSILWQAQSGGGGGGNIPATRNLLKGDGSGNALAASPNIDYTTPSNVDTKISAHNSDTAAHSDIRGELADKQDTISDLETIRDGAALGATAVQPESGKGLFSGNYNDLSNKPTIPAEQVNSDWNATSGKAQILNKPTIPAAVTESTVAGWGFTKNTGTYSKPSSGIPKTDLASGVQSSLDKADSALQEHQSLAAYRTSAAQDVIDGGKQPTISDLETIRSGAAAGATAYQKPSSGIPKTDLASAVQTSLGRADSALQSVPSTYRTAAAQDTIDNGKVDKVSGKGLSTNDYTTTEKNKLAGIEAGAEVNDVENIVAGTNVTVTKTGKVYTISASGGGGGGSIPATTNLLMGDGSGNAADSEITADEVIDALDNKIPLISDKAEIVILGYYGAAATVAQINAAYPASAHPGAYAYSSLMRKLFRSERNSWTEAVPSSHNVYIYGTDERWFRWDGSYMREANYSLSNHTHAALDALVALGLPTPTAADKGKVLGIDDSGHYALISATPPTPTTDCTISVNVVGLANDTVLYVEYNGTKYYTNGSQFTVPNGASLYCYAFFSASNNWVKLNGTTVASGSPAEYTLTVTGNVAVTLDGSPGDRGHITLTM